MHAYSYDKFQVLAYYEFRWGNSPGKIGCCTFEQRSNYPRDSPTNEICFKAFTAPSYKCTDPNCVRIHDKNKIYEVVSKNLKDMMEAKNSVHSIQEASIDAPIIDMETTLDNSSP